MLYFLNWTSFDVWSCKRKSTDRRKRDKLARIVAPEHETSVWSKTTRSYHHSLEACRFIFSEQVLQRKCVSSFQRGQRLWDSARQSPRKALRCVTLVITITCTSLIQICITRIYSNFLIVLRPSSDLIRIFLCAGVDTGLISVCIYLHRCLKWNLELHLGLLPCSDRYMFSDIYLSKISHFHL